MSSRGLQLRPAVTFQVDLLVSQGLQNFRIQIAFADKIERLCCSNKRYKCYIKCIESPDIVGGGM